MTVAQLEAEMPNAEYVKWQVYYGRRMQQEQLNRQKRKRK